jgi:hypothetical protein
MNSQINRRGFDQVQDMLLPIAWLEEVNYLINFKKLMSCINLNELI